jgi:predicted DNA-binding transcriptional regulator AlpA
MQALLSESELEQLIHTTVSAAVSKIKPIHFPAVMNKSQLANYLGKKKSTIDSYMKQGLPYRKEGKDYPEFYKPQIDEWIRERFAAIETEVVQ